MMDQYLTNLSRIVSPAIGISFVVWAFRYRGEMDHKLTPLGKKIRWAIVLMSYGIAAIPTSFEWMIFVRPPMGILGFAFLAWPNFAYHIAKQFENRAGISSNRAREG
jgi:hypothetical protein